MNIEKNKVVTITYTLQESNESGEVIQEVNNKEPFTFLFGHNQVLPQFEESLEGKSKDTEFEFSISSEDGYGEHDPNAITELPIGLFMKDGKLHDFVKIGHFLPMNDDEGNQLQGLVLEISDEIVKMDFNHPMSGMDLYFNGKIIEVRNATEDELTQGQVLTP